MIVRFRHDWRRLTSGKRSQLGELSLLEPKLLRLLGHVILQKYRALNVLGIGIRGLRRGSCGLLLLLLRRFLRIRLGQGLLTSRHLLGIVSAILLVHRAHVRRFQSQQSDAVTSFHALLCSNQYIVIYVYARKVIKSVSYQYLDFANRPPT